MAITVNGSAAGSSSPGIVAVHSVIESRQFCHLADLLDNLELEVAASGASKPEDWPYAVHVLAHVVNHDLNSARFVWKRTAQAIKESSPELVAAWKIVQNMWTHDHAGVYKALKGYDWSELVQPVATAISNDYSSCMLRLLSTAYSTVSVADASGFLGLSENETVTCESSFRIVLEIREWKLSLGKCPNATTWMGFGFSFSNVDSEAHVYCGQQEGRLEPVTGFDGICLSLGTLRGTFYS